MQAMNRTGAWLVLGVAAVLMTACGGGVDPATGSDGGGTVAKGATGSGSGSDSGSGSGSGVGSGTGSGSGIGGGGGSTIGTQPDTGAAPTPSWTLGIAAVAQRGLRLDWDAVPGATGYELALDRDTSDGAASFQTLHTLNAAAATTYTFTDQSLVEALRYGYRVRACVEGDCSKEAKAEVAGNLHEAADVIVGTGLNDTSGFGRVMSTAAGTTVASGQAVGVQWLAVGAPLAGQVRVYQRPTAGGQWSQAATLQGVAAEQFGASVSFSSDGLWLAVGVPRDSTDGAGVAPVPSAKRLDASGAVRVYKRRSPTTSEWKEFVYLKAFKPAARDGFGSAVAINNAGYLVVGAPFEGSPALGAHPASDADDPAKSAVFDASPAGEHSGAVYLYHLSADQPPSSDWRQTYLKPWTAAPAAQLLFGSTLALSADNRLAVGAPRASWPTNNTGAVQVYSLNEQTGQFVHEADIAPAAADKLDQATAGGFGSSLSMNSDGTMLAVGYPDRAGAVGSTAGAAYVYERSGLNGLAEWRALQSFVSPTPATTNRFGMSVHLLKLSASRSMLLIGNWGDGAQHVGLQRSDGFTPSASSGMYRDTGGAFSYELVDGAWSVKARMKAPRIGSNDIDRRMGQSVVITQDGSELFMGAESDSTVVGY